MEIPAQTAELVKFLALKYESADFLLKDPSQFMHRYDDIREIETVAFISANLAFGRREQILLHIESILKACKSSPVNWILSKEYENFFPDNEKSFYRMYTNKDMRLFFLSLKNILENSETIGEYFKVKWLNVLKSKKDNEKKSENLFLHTIIADEFSKECKLLPHSKDSAAKKVNMLLRWLVRTDSPVDLGLWTWYDKKDLLMPLDTHVMQQANKLELISSKSANLRTAVELTKKVAGIFPDDPVKADFALFGLGVS